MYLDIKWDILVLDTVYWGNVLVYSVMLINMIMICILIANT